MKSSARLLKVLLCVSLFFLGCGLAKAANITLTATVPAQPTDYSATLSSNTGETVYQDTDIEYAITYGTNLSYVSQVTLQASWSRGTIEGNASPSVDVLTYVSGSASKAYNDTLPIIDTVNRKITWKINNFPGNLTNQKVYFKLHTSNTLTSTTHISFTVTGNLSGPGVTTPGSTITKSFIYGGPSGPTATPTPGPTATPTSGPSVTLSPSPVPSIPSQPALESVEVLTKTPDQAKVQINLNQPAGVVIDYGTALNALSNSISQREAARSHTVTLAGLSPGTKYYLKISLLNNGSLISPSELYEFTTGTGEVPLPDIRTFVAASQNVIMTGAPELAQASGAAFPAFLLPASSYYEFRIFIPNSEDLTSTQALVRNKLVLGISSFMKLTQEDTSNSKLVDLIEISKGIFSGRLRAPDLPGYYEIYLKLADNKGNIIERKVSTLRVSDKFTINDAITKRPIEDARVLLSYWDEKKDKYIRLRSSDISIPNPSYSHPDGNVDIILVKGKYKAEISNLNYKTQEVAFTIGQNPDDGYPQVSLIPQPFNILNSMFYYTNTFNEVFLVNTGGYLAAVSTSQRMLDLVTLAVMICFVILLILSLAARTRISLLAIPAYFVYLYRETFVKRNRTCTFSGKVVDADNDKPVPQVMLYITDEKTGTLISHAVTNDQGVFFTRLCEGPYTITVLRQGYRPFAVHHIFKEFSKKQLIVALTSQPTTQSRIQSIFQFIDHLLSTGFEVIVILSILIALAAGLNLGIPRVLPVLIIAFVSLGTLLLHERQNV